MNLKDRVYVKPDKQVRLKVREIAVIIENRIKNSKVHEQVQEKQERQLQLRNWSFRKLGKQNTILLSESTSNCKNVIHSNSSMREPRI